MLKIILLIINLSLIFIIMHSMKGYTDKNSVLGTRIILSVLGANALALAGGIL